MYPAEGLSPADVFPGSCRECGEDMDFNMEDCTHRERELSTELYFRGYTLATLTASRRAMAAVEWLNRRGKDITAPPGEVYKQALIDEHDRRMGEKWVAHLATMPDDLLAFLGELLEHPPPEAELEAILWPEPASPL